MWTQWIDTAILVVLAGGIMFTWLQLHGMRRTRDADLLSHLGMMWDSDPLRDSRAEINACASNFNQALQQSQQQDIPKFLKLLSIANYFETIGLLVKLNCLSHKAAKELFGNAIWEYYKLYDGYIKTHRGEDPQIYIHFEELMKKNLTK